MVMSTNSSVECPVNFVPINEIKVRIIALQVLIISTLYVITAWPPLIVFLLADFFARGFGYYRFSVLAQVASAVIKLFSLANRPIDQAPKQFAARIGIVLCLVILIFHSGFPLTAMTFGVMFSLSSFLESSIGFCAGCYVYSIGKKLTIVE
jgi:hypothetical protein